MGGGRKWSLGPTKELLAEIGDPHLRFPTIHVAGTNGKGSTATLIAAALGAAGHRVGLYTSPHLVDLRERVLVGGHAITADAFTTWTDRLQPVIEATGASFFEAYTAIAMADFAARGVDIAVIETGLGGRLDSTNILEPLVSLVTEIGLDHTEYLGPELTDIAWEKAHVAKEGVPFVIGERSPPLVDKMTEVALQRGARPVVVAPESRYEGRLGMLGAHQGRNAAVAVAALAQLDPSWGVTEAGIARSFATARIPGRIDRRGKWIFDIAHNVHALTALLATLDTLSPERPLHGLIGILGDKDYRTMLAHLDEYCDRIWFTVAPGAPGARRLDAPQLPPGVVFEPDFARALAAAPAGAATVLVTGSTYTVGDAMARLPGLSPLG